MNIKNLTILDTDLLNSSVALEGNGILNFLGFLIGDNNVGTFLLQNIKCQHNIASYGACLYFSSNNILFLTGFLSYNNSGSIFNIESDDYVELVFEKVDFRNSNYYAYEQGVNIISATNPLIVFIKEV